MLCPLHYLTLSVHTTHTVDTTIRYTSVEGVQLNLWRKQLMSMYRGWQRGLVSEW